ncbi:hypothetical protein [Corynebacterium hiratae]|uniref:hypothetical protein n=1 Tax=Corynebacterium hiratae TaxID=3139423 RepID=UPI00272EE35F|nr:hypothetical protein [Corynebacterium aurimucosum]
MTDLSTANLKRLLDEATPGPWRAEVGAAGVPEGWDEHWIALHMGHNSMYDVGREPPAEEEYANFTLAALAPELADEVLRMREALHDLSEVWEEVSIDPQRTSSEQLLAAHVVDHIDQILGDTE